MRPPPHVLAAFGAAGADPVPLAGGAGTAWRAGDIVLKPLDMGEDALAWQAAVLGGLEPAGVRVTAPLRTAGGALTAAGWTAWPHLAGRHEPRWPEILAAGEVLHAALRDVPRPDGILDARTDRWARADRAVWGERDGAAAHGSRTAIAGATPASGSRTAAARATPALGSRTATAGAATAPGVRARILARLRTAAEPVHPRSQVVHGDLSGNVLLAEGLPPAVIDLSPYWRPTAYAAAIVLVDAVLWHGAPVALLDVAARREDGPQCLLRAVAFRLLCENEDETAAIEAYEPLAERARALAGRA
jgi:hypothetical protein